MLVWKMPSWGSAFPGWGCSADDGGVLRKRLLPRGFQIGGEGDRLRPRLGLVAESVAGGDRADFRAGSHGAVGIGWIGAPELHDLADEFHEIFVFRRALAIHSHRDLGVVGVEPQMESDARR